MRPYVMQRLLLSRTQPEIIELTRHGFVAAKVESDGPFEGEAQLKSDEDTEANHGQRIVGFSAVEIYSTKLAELQCLAVHHEYQGSGVGKALVARCVERARDLNVMEVMAISSSENFLLGCGFEFSLPDQKKALFCRLRERSHE